MPQRTRPLPGPTIDGVDRARSPVALLGAVGALAAFVAVAVLGRSAPDVREAAGPVAAAAAPTAEVRPLVTAFVDGPWLGHRTDTSMVITASGTRHWIVDVDRGSVHPGREHRDRPSSTPVIAVEEGFLVTQWGGVARAVPLRGGAPVDLGPTSPRVREAAFDSERPGAVWVLEPAPDDAVDRVVAVEHALDGGALRTAAGTFPTHGPPFAAADDGLLVHGGTGPDGEIHLVDPVTGARRVVSTLGRGRRLLAADHATVVFGGLPCLPGCSLTVVDVATGEHRVVPAPPGTGIRASDGSISPDGSTMVHAASTLGADDTRAHYVVTDLRAGVSRMTDVAAGVGVAWSPDGSTFFAAPARRGGHGTDHRLVAHHVPTGVTTELPVLVRMPLGVAWTLG